MSGLAKAFVVINLILALFFLGASATLFQANKNWKKVAEDGAAESTKLRTEVQAYKEAKEGRIGALEQNVSVLDTELATLRAQKQDLENENGSLKTDKSGLQKRLTTLESQLAQKDQHIQDKDNAIAAKDEEISRLIREKSEADEAMTEANTRASRISLDLAQQIEAQEDLLTELAQTRKELDGKAIQLAQIAEAGIDINRLSIQAVPRIEGVVSAVRGDIVVLSVGRDDQVKEGFEFTIYEEDRFIGKVRVESLLEDMSGAKVLFTEPGKSIRAGQKAATRLAGA